jgi:hypothetical protein
MRLVVSPVVVALGLAIAAPVAAITSGGVAFAQQQPAAPPQDDVKQIALTQAQIDQTVAAKKEIDAVIAQLPQTQSAQPDPKTMAKLDAVAKKYKFSSYDEYDDVSSNIGLVMAGVDPQTKKYVGPEAVIKKEIAEVQADAKIPAKDKKEALDQLNGALTSVVPVTIPGNIQLVTKNYDKLAAVLSQD